jgi:pimeloyl-ACP methyl ester carboxylesterase
MDQAISDTLDTPTGFGSVTGVPHLPAGFTDTFSSRFVDANGIRIHAVIGGEGPPLLLMAGWPQTWYAWRGLMPTLAKNFTVISVDIRGFGLTEKPRTGYDPKTTAWDMLELMQALGHDQFSLVGHDLGLWIGYAMGIEAPERIVRLGLVEGVMPGLTTSFPMLGTKTLNDFMWHFAFNRTEEINERMVEGREDIYFRHQFASKSASPTEIPEYAVQHYIQLVKNSNLALKGTFAYYRAIEQVLKYTEEHRGTQLPMPVFALAGSKGCGELTLQDVKAFATDITWAELEGVGHFCLDAVPEAILRELLPFLAPYADEAKSS